MPRDPCRRSHSLLTLPKVNRGSAFALRRPTLTFRLYRFRFFLEGVIRRLKIRARGVPLSSEYGTHKTVKARFWPSKTVKARFWRSGKSLVSASLGGCPADQWLEDSDFRLYEWPDSYQACLWAGRGGATRHPKPETRNPKPEPKPRNPESGFGRSAVE